MRVDMFDEAEGRICELFRDRVLCDVDKPVKRECLTPEGAMGKEGGDTKAPARFRFVEVRYQGGGGLARRREPST